MKIYIYPTYTPSRDKSGNLYIKYFHEAFDADEHCLLVNRFWKIGIASMFFNLDANVYIIHWVDLIPKKRFGIVQSFLFLIGITLIKMMRKRLIWVLHNKQAHAGKSWLVDFCMKFMAEKADDVIVHANEGVDFFNTMYPTQVGKCRYVPHPVYNDKIYPSFPVKYDYVIWGTIGRHKNVLEFLRFFNVDSFFCDKTVLVCGRCPDVVYDGMIHREVALNKRITYINRFLTDDELRLFVGQAHTILFTYNPESVLSSGALVYSFNFCKPIIGPRVGSFVDMVGIVGCYDEFSDIPSLKSFFVTEHVKNYLHFNTWNLFPTRVLC